MKPRAKISGPPDDLAGGRVDHRRDGDEALLTEDAPVFQLLLGDVTDVAAVDVDVAAIDLAGDLDAAVDQIDDHAVVDAETRSGGTPRRDGQLGMGAQVAPLAVDRDRHCWGGSC